MVIEWAETRCGTTRRVAFDALPGVMLRETPVRTYPQGSLAAHVIGYLGEISSQELAMLESQGYMEGDAIGRVGLERWGETYLAGGWGGTLTIVTPSGELVDTVVEYPATQSRSIYCTIDTALQKVAEEAPVVLFAEDLQWADAPSLELIEILLRRLDVGDNVAVTAHRGASLRAPENSMAAFREAYAAGQRHFGER